MSKLTSGQVLTITSSGGTVVEEVKLKLLDTSLLTLKYNKETNNVDMEIKDTDLTDIRVDGVLSKNTLKDFIRSLVQISGQLVDEETNE